MMEETRACNSVCDTLLFINEAAYAVLPRDVAHALGEVKRNFWSGVRWLVDKELEWIDKTIEGSDRLREEWRQKGSGRATSASNETAGGI